MNVYDVALEMEEHSREFYEKLATESSSKEMAVLFSLLADSEREHCERLAQLKTGMDTEGSSSVALDRIKNRLGEVVSVITEKRPVFGDGYGQVIKAEETSIRLYEKLAEQEPNGPAATALRQLAEEERLHLEVIENIYEFVESPRTYLEYGEFSNLHPL